MLAAIKVPQKTNFDLSEIEPELELIFKPYRALKPVKAGDLLPDFSLQKENAKWQQFFNGSEINGSVFFRQLLNKPLVIGFYSNKWQAYGLDLLKRLNTIQHEIKARGGNLLIITDEKGKALDKLVWENSLSLNFYFDSDFEIAEKFRLYSEHDPIWNKFSGIDVNVPLLATYVISVSGEIKYDHISYDLAETVPATDIIFAVQQAGSLNDDNKVRSINSRIGVKNIQRSDF